MNEILVEDYRTEKNKISIILKNIDQKNLTNLKCFKHMEEVQTIEAKKINLIKMQKSVFLNLQNLIYLDLRENKLEKIPKNLILLKNLKALKLDFNQIGFIPTFINELEKLEILNLNNNKIKYFPSQFQNLQNLKELKIANNLIEAIPIEFGLLKSLEILHIEGNYFTDIPTTLCYLKYLSELSFEWLEFLDPPFQRVIKDNLGKTIITLIKNSLQEQIKKNKLYCSFLDFIERNSNNSNNLNYNFDRNSLNRNSINSNINSVYASVVFSNDETKKENFNANINTDFDKVINNLNETDLHEEHLLQKQKSNNNLIINKKPENLNENILKEITNKEIIETDQHNYKNNDTSIGNFFDIKEEKYFMKKVNSIKEKKSSFNANIKENKANDFLNKHNQKIFYAIDNNYVGVIKALESNYDEIIKIKNVENKTPLYYCIHNNKIEIADLFISKTDFSKISNAYVYLHKAIRIRDTNLVGKLLQMGISTKETDDQGSTVFHILFGAFNKHHAKCALIGEMLLGKTESLNSFNNDGWAPIHIASRRGSINCVNWIMEKNKSLYLAGKQVFDVNLRGKNKWTPLHLAANSYRYEITILLIENGADIFARNNENKTPRKVTNGNCILSKLLRNYEEEIFNKNFFNKNNSNNTKIKQKINFINKASEANKLEESNNLDTIPNENQLEDISNLKIKNLIDNQFSNRILETIQTKEEVNELDEEAKLEVDYCYENSSDEVSETEEICKENNLDKTKNKQDVLQTLELKNHIIMLDLNNANKIKSENIKNAEMQLKEKRFKSSLEKIKSLTNNNEFDCDSNNKNKNSEFIFGKNNNIIDSAVDKKINFTDKNAYIKSNNEINAKQISFKKNLAIKIENIENLDEAGAEEKKNIVTEKSPNKNNNDIKSLDNTNNKIYFESEENYINTKNFINEFRYENNKDYSKISLMKTNKNLSKILNKNNDQDFSMNLSPILGFKIVNSNSVDLTNKAVIRKSKVNHNKSNLPDSAMQLINVSFNDNNNNNNLNQINSENACSIKLISNSKQKKLLNKSPQNSVLIDGDNYEVNNSSKNEASKNNYLTKHNPTTNIKVNSKSDQIKISDRLSIHTNKLNSNNKNVNAKSENILTSRSKNSQLSKSKAGLTIKTDISQLNKNEKIAEFSANKKIEKTSKVNIINKNNFYYNNNIDQQKTESISNATNNLNSIQNNNLSINYNHSQSKNNLTSFCENNKTLRFSGNLNISSSNKKKYSFLKTKTNLYYHKEIILDTENSLSERMESLMYLKLYAGIFKNVEVQNILKAILENIDFEEESNISFITEICYLIFSFSFFELLSVLEITEKKLFFQKSLLGKLAQKEVNNIIKTFKAVQDSLKKTINFDSNNNNNYNANNDNYLPIIADANSLINLNTNLINFDTYNTNTNSSCEEDKIIFSNRTNHNKAFNIKNANYHENNNTSNNCFETEIHNNQIEISNNKFIEVKNNSHQTNNISKNHFTSKNELNAMKSKIENLNNDEFSLIEEAIMSSKRELSYKNFDDFFLKKNILSTTNRSENHKIPGSKSIINNLNLEFPTEKIEAKNEFSNYKSKNSFGGNINRNKNNAYNINTNSNSAHSKNVDSNNEKNYNKDNSSRTIKFSLKSLVLNREDSNDNCPENVLDSLIKSDSNTSINNSKIDDICAKSRISFNKNDQTDKFFPSKFIVDPKKTNKDKPENNININNAINYEYNNENSIKNRPFSKGKISAIKPRIPSEPKNTNLNIFDKKNEVDNLSNYKSNTVKKTKLISLAKPQLDVKRNTMNKFEISRNKGYNNCTNNLNDNNNELIINKKKNQDLNKINKNDNINNKNINSKVYKHNNFKDAVQFTTINSNNDIENNQPLKSQINKLIISNNKEQKSTRRNKNINTVENLNSENSQEKSIKDLQEHEYHLNNIKNLNNKLSNLISVENQTEKKANININYNVNYNINYNFNSEAVNSKNTNADINSNFNSLAINNRLEVNKSYKIDKAFFPSSTKADSFNNNFFTYYNKRKLKNKKKEHKENFIINNKINFNNFNNYNNSNSKEINNKNNNINLCQNRNSVNKLNSNIDSLYLSHLNNLEYENFLNNINAEANTSKRPKNVYFKSSSDKVQPVLLKENEAGSDQVVLTEILENKFEINKDIDVSNNNSLKRNSEVFESRKNVGLKKFLTKNVFVKNN